HAIGLSLALKLLQLDLRLVVLLGANRQLPEVHAELLDAIIRGLSLGGHGADDLLQLGGDPGLSRGMLLPGADDSRVLFAEPRLEVGETPIGIGLLNLQGGDGRRLHNCRKILGATGALLESRLELSECAMLLRGVRLGYGKLCVEIVQLLAYDIAA